MVRSLTKDAKNLGYLDWFLCSAKEDAACGFPVSSPFTAIATEVRTQGLRALSATVCCTPKDNPIGPKGHPKGHPHYHVHA